MGILSSKLKECGLVGLLRAERDHSRLESSTEDFTRSDLTTDGIHDDRSTLWCPVRTALRDRDARLAWDNWENA